MTRSQYRGEPIDVLGILPATVGGEPARRGEVVVGDARQQAVFVAGGEHAPVVVERGDGEVAFLRLDAGPLDGEAVGVEPELGEQGDVLRVAVKVVARVAGRLGEQAAGRVLEQPEVGVEVVALDLVGGGCRTPHEAVRKAERHATLLHSGPAVSTTRGRERSVAPRCKPPQAPSPGWERAGVRAIRSASIAPLLAPNRQAIQHLAMKLPPGHEPVHERDEAGIVARLQHVDQLVQHNVLEARRRLLRQLGVEANRAVPLGCSCPTGSSSAARRPVPPARPAAVAIAPAMAAPPPSAARDTIPRPAPSACPASVRGRTRSSRRLCCSSIEGGSSLSVTVSR